MQAAARLDHKNGTLHLGDKGFEGETRRSQLTNLAKGLQVNAYMRKTQSPYTKHSLYAHIMLTHTHHAPCAPRMHTRYTRKRMYVA